MKRIKRQDNFCLFEPNRSPVAEVEAGEEVLFETWDALGGRVQSHADALSLSLRPDLMNPATGPVYVHGAQPGDTLAVTIREIRLGERCQCRLRPGAGVIINELRPPGANLIPVKDNIVHFNERIQFPARPMVGVIGTVPAGEPVLSLYPGAHGGNLDINELRPGATIYLPVAVPGALLAVGDVHASMGDGELTGGGIDIPAEVIVATTIHKNLGWKRPVIETPTAWCTCANAAGLAGAIQQATSDVASLIAGQLGMSREESFLLIGAVGDARIGQAAQLQMDVTAYIRISKEILPLAF